MFIKKVRFENYIGIKNGTGLDELELNFDPDSDNIITLLSGKNGSGKSTLMSLLQPFKNTFDDRQYITVPGKDALKQIIIYDDLNDITWEINHRFIAKQNKTISSIKKNGVELNESGNNSSFEKIVEENIVTKEYFKIGLISTATESFINLSTADRKKYVGTFITQINDYLDMYDVAKTKYNTTKKQVDTAAEKLKHFTDIEVLKREITTETDKLNVMNDNIKNLIGEISSKKTTQNGYREKINSLNLYQLNSELQEKRNSSNKMSEALMTNTKTLEELEKELNTLTESKNINLQNLSKYEESLRQYNLNLVQANNKNFDLKSQRKHYNAEDFENTKKRIAILKSEIDKLNETLSKNVFYQTVVSNNNLNTMLTTFINMFDTLYENWNVLNNKDIHETKSNIALLFSSEYKETVNTFNSNIKNKQAKLSNDINLKRSTYASKQASLSQLKILDSRPKECTIDTCPFIVQALNLKYLPDELSTLSKEIEALDSENSENSELITKFNEVISVYRLIIDRFRAMDKSNPVYLAFCNKYSNIVEAFKMSKEAFKNAYEEIVNICETAINDYNQFNVSKNELTQLEYQAQLYTEYANNSERLEKEINQSDTEINNINKQIAEAQINVNNSKNIDANYQQQIQNINTVIYAIKTLDVIKAEIATLESNIELYNTNKTLYDSISIEINDKQNKLTQLEYQAKESQKELETKKFNLQTVEALQSELLTLQKSFDVISTVKDSLDPKFGIPLVFTQSYLTNVEAIASKLLSIAYGSEYEIKFNVTEKDFFIIVKHGDTIAEDVKICSQGEIALVTISISLALIQQSVGKYNILYLDEIDGPLDSNNRQAFINIINSQIAELGIKQVFVISHNNVYDYFPLNLIILKNSDFRIDDPNVMSNKKVIFNLEDVE